MKKIFIYLLFIYSGSALGQNSIQIIAPTPTASCAESSISVTFNSSGNFTNPNFTIKLKKIESCYLTSTTTIVSTYSSSSSPISINIPNTPPTTQNTGTYCSTMYGSFPASRSYGLTVVNGLDSSTAYTLNILPSCSSIQNVSSTFTCFGTNTLNSNFTTFGIVSGNVFTAELSDLGGTTFPVTPVVVGSLSSSTASTIPITLPSGTSSGTYKIKIKSSNPIGENTGTLTVIGIPTGLPTLTKNPTSPVAGGTNVTLTASDCPSGNGVLWSNGSQNSSIIVAPYSSTTYTATCKNNCGQAPTAASILVEVVIPPSITSNRYNFCPTGSSITLTAEGCSSPDLVTWYNASNGATLGTGLTYTSNVSSQIYFAAKCSRGGVQSAYSNQINITQASIPPTPTAITKSPNSSVGPYVTVTLSLATGGSYGVKWEDGSSSNPRYVNPAVTTNYTAKFTSQGCESSNGFTTTVTVDPNLASGISISSAPNVDYYSNGQAKICASENINLSSLGCPSPGVVKWYRKWYNSTPVQIGTGVTLTTNNNATADVDGRIFYYLATCTNGTVVSPYSNEVSVALFNNWTPTSIIATPSGNVNPGTSVSLLANGGCGNSTTIKWDDNTTASTRIVTPNATASYSYKCVNGACESSSVSKTVTVVCPTIYTPTLSTTYTNIGLGESADLTSYCASGTTIKWDDNSTASTRTVTPTASSTTYTAKCVNDLYNTCESGISSITIYTGTRPLPPTISGPTSVCLGSAILLTPSGCPANTSVYWYQNQGTNSFNSTYNNQALSVTPTANTTYYAKCYVNALYSLSSNTIEVTTLSLPAVATNITAVLTTPATPTVLLSANCSGATVSWYSKAATNFQVYPNVGVETLIGSGTSFSTNLSTQAAYMVKCTDAITTCVSSLKVNIPNSISGTSVSNIDGNYSFGSFVGTGSSYAYGTQTVDFVPPNVDYGTSYFTKGIVYNGGYYSQLSSSIQVIQRKDNNWEIWTYDGRPGGFINSSSRSFRTKFKYISKLPPCGVVWIKDSDGSEVNLTIGDFCENAVAVPVPNAPVITSTATTVCEGSSVSLTATGCAVTEVVEWFLGSAAVSFTSGNATINASPAFTNYYSDQTFTYTARCNIGGIKSLASNAINVTMPYVYAPQQLAVNPMGTIFTNASVTLTAQGCYSPNTVKWEDNSIINPRVIVATTSTTYSFKCVKSGCESPTSSATNLIVNPCPLVRILSSTASPTDDVDSGTIMVQAANATGGKITATNKITGTATVTYQAKSIELNAGFKADNGVVFLAQVGGCS